MIWFHRHWDFKNKHLKLSFPLNLFTCFQFSTEGKYVTLLPLMLLYVHQLGSNWQMYIRADTHFQVYIDCCKWTQVCRLVRDDSKLRWIQNRQPVICLTSFPPHRAPARKTNDTRPSVHHACVKLGIQAIPPLRFSNKRWIIGAFTLNIHPFHWSVLTKKRRSYVFGTLTMMNVCPNE